VDAGIGGMGEPWAGGSGSSQILSRVSRRAAEAAGQLADPVDRCIRRLSAQFAFRFGRLSPWTEGAPADDHRRSSIALQPRIGRRRALRGPWSVSSGLFAWASVRWKAAGSGSSRTGGLEGVPGGGDLG
jgi:hypothetical protein